MKSLPGWSLAYPLNGVRALSSQNLGELFAQTPVLLCQLPVALSGSFQPAQQGSIRGSLAGRDGCRGRSPGGIAEPLNLGPDIGLGVEPGPGDRCRAGDGLEGDCGALGIEGAQSLDRFGAGELVALLGGGDDVPGVVSPHPRPALPPG